MSDRNLILQAQAALLLLLADNKELWAGDRVILKQALEVIRRLE